MITLDPNNLIQPPAGLAYDANGVRIQNTGSGELHQYGQYLYGQHDAEIPNASTVVPYALGIADGASDGVIDIRSVTQIGLVIYALIGSLTSFTVSLEFSLDGASWYPDLVVSYTAGAVTFTNRTFTFTADTTKFFSMPNPGFNFMRVKTSSVGTITNSLFSFAPIRGWGNQNMVKV